MNIERQFEDCKCGNCADCKIEVAIKALEFYGDPDKYFMRDDVVNLQHTTAVFHTSNPEKLSTEYKTKTYECSARFKVDQGKTAREALEKIRNQT